MKGKKLEEIVDSALDTIIDLQTLVLRQGAIIEILADKLNNVNERLSIIEKVSENFTWK